MSIRCLILDKKNMIIDYADLNYPPGGGAQLVPHSSVTAETFKEGDIVTFQFEQRFDKVFDGVVINNKKNRLILDKVRYISNILQEDLRIEVFIDGVLTYEDENESKDENTNEGKDESIDENISEDKSKDENASEDEGKRKGYSVDITVKDISSGGIGFYTGENLPMNRMYEYVAEWGATPIITKLKLLRKEKLDSFTFSYGAKFVDLFSDEERVLRGGVFAIQARRCQDRSLKDDDKF